MQVNKGPDLEEAFSSVLDGPKSISLKDVSFRVLPQRFYIRSDLSAREFLHRYMPYQQSKKLILWSRWPWGKRLKSKVDSDLRVFRVHNENVLIWKKQHFYKYAAGEKSKIRLQQEGQALQALESTGLPWVLKKEKGLLIKDSWIRMPLLKPVHDFNLNKSHLDKTLVEIHRDMKLHSLSHGDFHINNLQKDENGQIFIIDWDMHQSGNFDLDLMGFFVHWMGFVIFKDYFKALQLLKSGKIEFIQRIREQGFVECAEVLQKMEDWPQSLKKFLLKRVEWAEKNQPTSEFHRQLKEQVEL